MTLQDIIKDVDVAGIAGDPRTDVSGLKLDSRAVAPGDLFFAVRGTGADGHDFIAAAVAAGAAAVVCERMPEAPDPGVSWVTVEDTAAAVGPMAANFYGRPSGKLRLVGVTGTNGKTTTATLLYDLMRGLGYQAGLLSTVVYRVGARETEATHTTPDAIRLNALLAEMVDAGCEYCFMEVSSHSAVQHRTGGLTFAGGIFTNITHDHLDYHGTFAEYIRAKKSFFDSLPPSAFALVNADDRNGGVMVQNTRAAVSTFSLRAGADFRCRVMEIHPDGMLLDMDSRQVWVHPTGRFNAYNLTGVYAAAVLLGQERDQALAALSALHSVSGRFEAVRSAGGVTAIVDYAHTPDALQNVLDTIDQMRTTGGRLYVVVGCGGGRDVAKRPVMARIAEQAADLVVLTSDNPRGEDPEEIIAQMRAGLAPGSRHLAIVDRREAIGAAVMLSAPGDIILVAGKGHEKYQIAGGVRSHFDDREEIINAFKTYDK